MKKPIDPNLNSDSREEIFDITAPNSALPKAEALPDFKVVDKDTDAETPKKTGESASSGGEHSHHHHHHHHHHSSDGKHRHHSSSGKHHHSSGKKHGSSDKKKMPVTAKIAIGIIIFIILAIIAAITGFFVYRNMGKNDLMPNLEESGYSETITYKGHTYEYNRNIVALGFIGIDRRQFENVKESNFVGAADTDIVVAVDTKTGVTKAIAIPRDTMVEIEVYSEDTGVYVKSQKAQLCLAYAYGDGGVKSCENTVAAMRRILLNVPIEKYFTLDLDGIAPLNDAIGGVKLTTQLDFPDMGIKAGDNITLQGSMAETYVRERDLSKLDSSLQRNERQIQYVKAYANQLLPAVVNDFSTVNSLYSTASKYSKTNLTMSNATYLASLLLQKRITDFETYTIKGEMNAAKDPLLPGIVHAEFEADDDSVMETVLSVFYTRVD